MPFYHAPIRWVAVHRLKKPCPVCGKPDWCSVSADGVLCVCMRIAAGSLKRTRNGGYLHRLTGTANRDPSIGMSAWVPRQAAGPAWSILWQRCRADVTPRNLQILATALGVSVPSLTRLGIGWIAERTAWAFAMRNADGRIIGFRLRTRDGMKSAVNGSRNGLFIPAEIEPAGGLLICEGPTDAAAGLDLGFSAIGRPSCRGALSLLSDYVRLHHPHEVIIFGDGDAPGRQGAMQLAERLLQYCRVVRVVLPPGGVKDLREWKRMGATRSDLRAAIVSAQPIQVAVKGCCR